MDQAFSWIVTILGLIGFWLAGKKIWWSWYVNIVNQIMWVIFALITDYYAFLVGTAAYFFVFCKNAYHWTKEHFDNKLLPGMELLVKDYEAQAPALLRYCGHVSAQLDYACTKPIGHEDRHGYAGLFWTDEDGSYSLTKRVIYEPPGNCIFTPIKLPDGSTTAECHIEHIHIQRNPYI